MVRFSGVVCGRGCSSTANATGPFLVEISMGAISSLKRPASCAAALVVASREAADRRGLAPLARIVGWATVGCDPKIMGIGPAPAIRRCLEKTGMKLEQIDLVEVNEAFAPQYLAVEKELGLPRDKTNVDGGAIALGHPLAASGARITTHLVYELRRRGKKLAIGSACIGGGQGIAVVVESV